MTSNFAFLHKHFPVLENFGTLAERYCHDDSNAAIIKLGMLGETIVNLIFEYDRIPLPHDNTAATRISLLARKDLLPGDIGEALHLLRKKRNEAAHKNYASTKNALLLLQIAHAVCEWFFRVYADAEYTHTAFVPPEQPAAPAPAANTQAEEATAARLVQQARANASAATPISLDARTTAARTAASRWEQSEAETRCLIDAQLRMVGWEVDTQELRYSKGTRPQKGRNLAIAEWPTDSSVGVRGSADYALFCGTQLMGFVEAKAFHKDVSAVLDSQAKEYARNVRAADASYCLAGTWTDNGYGVPFIFATNGRKYIEQLQTKSGIWFQDLTAPSNPPTALRGWPSPQSLEETLAQKAKRGAEKLAAMPYDLLTDRNGLKLRHYQLHAIQAVEQALAEGKTKMLLAMATGTGKTRTILGLIYRLLKSERFRRVLFLVDRTSLGEQAQDVFADVRIEDLLPLAKIYNVQSLEDKEFDRTTRIQVATIQGMVKRVLYNDGDAMPSVADYDLVIIDEAHRGYILDREMSPEELLYHDPQRYQSTYRSILDYFTGVKIALTATPALQTTRIFGEPIFQYTYREAVVDGYLVDHDAPHIIHTKLNSEGIHFSVGETPAVFDPYTGELTNSAALEDELDFNVEHFNKKVITEAFNRTVLAEIAKDLDPTAPDQHGKTLIYAVNDQHADLVVQILKEIYGAMDVPTDAIMKITGATGGGDRKKVLDAIKRFKNEAYPSIAVTVDLLTTGIDVPEITTLVFLRQVRSRILYDQMLGRATRLCPAINKTHFEIYDAVRLYEFLSPLSTMKPVVANPHFTYAEMLDELARCEENERVAHLVTQILARLQRTKRRLRPEQLEQFRALADGLSPDLFIQKVIALENAAAKKDNLLAKRELFNYLHGVHSPYALVISDKPDVLRENVRGYGDTGQRPEDYLEGFARFIREQRDKIAALNIILTRPSDLTRDSLKDLSLALQREGYTEHQLNTALGCTDADMAADIISLIRRVALGSHLLPHEERVRNAIRTLKAAHSFSKMELTWIDMIERYLLKESVINVQTFNEDPRFQGSGGFNRLNKIFSNNLEGIIRELNQYLYDDGAQAA